ncbi:hypothetical protein C8R47DRAFT_1114766 [Mycena vitilis]|nr:hypothetical protein C8R47DRAFT_1114766 [Mycena vitilis]
MAGRDFVTTLLSLLFPLPRCALLSLRYPTAPTPVMSILVRGVYTSSVYTSDVSPVTVISEAFRSRLPLVRSSGFALTVNGGPNGSFTTVLPCFVSPHLSVDICLGLDWKAGVREWLIGLGLNPATYLSYLSAAAPCSSAIAPTTSRVASTVDHAMNGPINAPSQDSPSCLHAYAHRGPASALVSRPVPVTTSASLCPTFALDQPITSASLQFTASLQSTGRISAPSVFFIFRSCCFWARRSVFSY